MKNKTPTIVEDVTSLMKQFDFKVKEGVKYKNLTTSEEDMMYFSIILGVLTITTDYQESYVVLTEVAAYELTDVNDTDGGLLSITLKGNNKELVFGCKSEIAWKEAKKWFDAHQLDIIEGMTQAIKKEAKKARF